MSSLTVESADTHASPTATSRAGGATIWAAIGLTLCAAVVVVLFPGDTQFRSDEQNLLVAAAEANRDGRLVTQGLVGSAGVRYGPLPTQFYQLVMLFTSDLRTIVLVRSLAFAVTMWAALWSIGRSMRLRPWFAAVAMTAPWVWYYVRTPWDNTFALPLGCGLLAVYARWLDRPRQTSAATWSGLAVLMPLVHLAAVALPVAVFAHALVARFSAVRRTLFGVVLGAAVACASSMPYLRSLPTSTAEAFHGETSVDLMERISIAAYALRAPEILGAAQSYYRAADGSPGDTALAVTSRVGYLSFLWFVAGVAVIALRRVPTDRPDTTQALAAISIGSILLLGAVLSVAKVNWHPHYLVGVFASTAVLCWIGVDAIWSHRLGRWILVLLPATTTMASTLAVFALIHRNGGGANRFGHSVGTLMNVVDELGETPGATVYTDSGELHLRRNTLADLRWISARGKRPANSSKRAEEAVVVRLRQSFPQDHHLVVERASLTSEQRDRLFVVPAWPDRK